jgi:hypothetical protein
LLIETVGGKLGVGSRALESLPEGEVVSGIEKKNDA